MFEDVHVAHAHFLDKDQIAGFSATLHHLDGLDSLVKVSSPVLLKHRSSSQLSDDTGSSVGLPPSYCEHRAYIKAFTADGNDLQCGTGSKDEEMALRRSGNA